MPAKDWMEYYENEEFWLEVRRARQVIPHPDFVKQESYTTINQHGLIFRFRKFSFHAPAQTLMGTKFIETFWMFETIVDHDDNPRVDLILKW